jgi:hypothetical protein
MENLPTHLSQWKPWRREVLRRVRTGVAERDLQKLVAAGCEKESLLFRLAAIVGWHGKVFGKTYVGLTRYEIKVAPTKLRKASNLICRLQKLFAVQDESSPAIEQLGRSLRLYADSLDASLLILLRPGGLTMEVAAICSLIGYVQRTTTRHKPHDPEVSGLIGAVLGKDSYPATQFTQWRFKHRKEIASMSEDIVNPLYLPVPSDNSR